MRRYTRHQLKEDRFAEATAETLSWAAQHQKSLTVAAILVLLAVGLVLGGWAWMEKQDDKASAELGHAIRTYHAMLRPEGTPADPSFPSFTSGAERAKTAQSEFQQIAQKYRYTHSGDIARYYLGITATDLNDFATAEKELKAVSGVRDKELAALAKLALASVYRSTGRDKDAIDIYKDLAEHSTHSVPKPMAQLELAGAYEKTQPADALRLYQEIAKEEAQSPAGQIAAQKLDEMKK